MARHKVIGYFDSEPEDEDLNDRSGLSSEAYDNLIVGEGGTGLTVADLEDIEVKLA